jgi:hypothetical protein
MNVLCGICACHVCTHVEERLRAADALVDRYEAALRKIIDTVIDPKEIAYRALAGEGKK